MENDFGKSAPLGEEQLNTLVEAVGAAAASRVPLEVTLAALADEREDPRLAKVARQLSQQLERGATIDQAVASLGTQLPPEFDGLLKAGVESGDLAGTVEQFASERLAARRIRLRIRTALAYPLLILAILVPLVLFLSLVVIPVFDDLYRDFDLELPNLTLVMLVIAKALPAMLLGLLLLVFVLPALLALIGGRSFLHRIRSVVPLLGRLWMWSGQREFAGILSSFLERRLPTTSAIAHTSSILADRNLARACRRVDQKIQLGQSLSQALAQSIHFDRSLVALVAWGEKNGMVPDALRVAAQVFDDRIEQRVSWLRRLVPPLTMIGVALFIGLFAGSMFLPLVKLIEGLSG